MTKGGTLPLSVPELQALAAEPRSGDRLVRTLLADAESSWPAADVGILQIGRADVGGVVHERFGLGWPSRWFSVMKWRQVADRERPDEFRMGPPPGVAEQPLTLWWRGIWWSRTLTGSHNHYAIDWISIVTTAALLLMMTEIYRYACLVANYRSLRRARRSPDLESLPRPPAKWRRRRVVLLGLMLALALLLPRWNRGQQANPGVGMASAKANVTGKELRALLDQAAPDSALAARLLDVLRGIDADIQARGSLVPGGELIQWQWMWREQYAYIAFPDSELAFAMPTLAVQWSQLIPPSPPADVQPAICPDLPLSIGWNNSDRLEIQLPTRRGDVVRTSIIVEPAELILWLAGLYLIWRIVTGFWPAFVAYRSRRRWQRGLCTACAYPVTRNN